jgi:hypothetical protein
MVKAVSNLDHVLRALLVTSASNMSGKRFKHYSPLQVMNSRGCLRINLQSR